MSDSVLEWHSPEFYPQAHAIAATRVRFEDYKGHPILIIDLSHSDVQIVKAAAAECLHVIASQPRNSVLSLTEVQGIPFDTEALKIGSELTERCKPYSLRTAVSGVTGFRSFVLQTMADAAGRPMRLFKERAAAMEWLVTGD